MTVGTTIAVYGCYLTVVAANGYFGVLWQAKTTGVKRLLGLVQITGFHSSGGGSLTARLVAEGGYFLTTYILLVAGLPALVVVLRRGGQLPRMAGLFHCAAAATLCYALAFGTLEEQELYLLVVPSLLTVPMAVAYLCNGKGVGRRSAPRGNSWTSWMVTSRMVTLGAAFVLMIGANLVTCVQWARHPDDGFALLGFPTWLSIFRRARPLPSQRDHLRPARPTAAAMPCRVFTEWDSGLQQLPSDNSTCVTSWSSGVRSMRGTRISSRLRSGISSSTTN